MANIRIYRAEDWTTLYVDGKKVAENHSISLDTIAEYVDGMKVEWLPDKVDEAMSYFGDTMPDDLDEVPYWSDDIVAEKEADNA